MPKNQPWIERHRRCEKWYGRVMLYPPGERRDRALARLKKWEGLLRQHPNAAQVQTVPVEDEILSEIKAVLVVDRGSRQYLADWQKWLDLGGPTDLTPPTMNAKLQTLVSRLRLHRATLSPQPPVVIETDQDKPAEPKTYLWNWKEILDAVGRKDTPENRRHVQRLSDTLDGPIVVPKSGSGPKAIDKAKLLEWWNRIDDLHLELQQQDRDRQGTVADQYDYGSEGTVVPEIGGAVKKRRRDAKQ